jgi:hypothetical protein
MMHERTNVLIDLQGLPNQFDLNVRILDESSQALLNTLHLLRDRAQNTLLQSIELVETAPCSNLTKTDEYTTHGLEIERFIAAEHQDESTELDTEGLDRFGFS